MIFFFDICFMKKIVYSVQFGIKNKDIGFMDWLVFYGYWFQGSCLFKVLLLYDFLYLNVK